MRKNANHHPNFNKSTFFASWGLKYSENYQPMTHTDIKWANAVWENGTNRLVNAGLSQTFVFFFKKKKTVSAKHNKMRHAYIYFYYVIIIWKLNIEPNETPTWLRTMKTTATEPIKISYVFKWFLIFSQIQKSHNLNVEKQSPFNSCIYPILNFLPFQTQDAFLYNM